MFIAVETLRPGDSCHVLETKSNYDNRIEGFVWEANTFSLMEKMIER